jgi:hypothetical protein
MTMTLHSVSIRLRRPRYLLTAATCLCFAVSAARGYGQTPAARSTPSPAAQSSQPAPKQVPISSANLADRAYSEAWPRPSFPASDREPKQFTVEYVYRYVQSDYKPPVTLPVVRHSEAQTDTPEHTLIAAISAVKTLDYDWWLSLWDVKSQAIFRERATTDKQDAAFWKAFWQANFPGKAVTLESRIELVFDIMLEFRVGTTVNGKGGGLQPIVLRREDGHWALTLELSKEPFLPWTGQNVISGPLDLTPLPPFNPDSVPDVAVKAQSLFFSNQPRGASSATDFVW